MIRLLLYAVAGFLVFSCSTATTHYYRTGDLLQREFKSAVPDRTYLSGDYYQIRKNGKGQVLSAKHFSSHDKIIETSSYTYDRDGFLISHHYIENFSNGLPRLSRKWQYDRGKLTDKEEQWYSRSRTLEKRFTVLYDEWQRPYLESTWGLGDRFESSTEFYYDYKGRLDKSRRNFFWDDGSLRDYWLTIYTDHDQIMSEEHYLPDNSLTTFYRYTYHPIKDYREKEEVLDAGRNIFTIRTFNEQGLILVEEEKDREMQLIQKRIFEYDENSKPLYIQHYDKNGAFIKKTKYQNPVYLKPSRTPGL
ncbi:MAG: hypothetical protein K9M49_04200 [Candidatus Marinimicrobia bacterium]|nr:hypothetical protein [Candidatus Neomarinimicrobiota bacterium]MCF7851115.1 hypothetical protein [Candidatus Neomarinimicrobiota bacterium]MCF7904337.1 hypothetical protein [Candidatus Neomarinimicrobiota bacterium]